MSIRVVIEKYDHLARGIAHLNGKVVFVKGALKGEDVLANVIKENKKYIEAETIRVIKKADERIDVLCPFFEKCGGCSFWHADYDEEVRIKLENFKDILCRYGNVNYNPKVVIGNKSYGYRNKITLKINNYEWGYYNDETHDFVSINYCLIAKSAINDIIKFKDLFDVKNGSIVIRCNYNNEILIGIEILDEAEININELCKNNKIVGIVLNGKIIYGEDYFIERIDNLFYKVNINSFFQVNTEVLREVFKIISKKEYKNVVDLYCGVGTLGISLKKEKLYGIEVNKNAVFDAQTNAKMNKQENNYYMLGDASLLEKIDDDIDLIIVDPPRSGLNKKTLDVLVSSGAHNIIYMSCNVITLARDLKEICNFYDINDMYVLDMFPRTKHVECVAVLNRKPK